MSHAHADRGREELVRRLSDLDDQYHVELGQQRQELMRNLISIVANDKSDEVGRTRAVDLLGDLRASEAAEILVENIVEIPTLDPRGLSSRGRYACVAALVKIGKPATGAVLKEFRKPISDDRQLALVDVLAGVEGRKVGRFLLEEEIADAKTAEERDNLNKALRMFLIMTSREKEATGE